MNQAISLSILGIIVILIKLRVSRSSVMNNGNNQRVALKKKQGMGNVDRVFFNRIK